MNKKFFEDWEPLLPFSFNLGNYDSIIFHIVEAFLWYDDDIVIIVIEN